MKLLLFSLFLLLPLIGFELSRRQGIFPEKYKVFVDSVKKIPLPVTITDVTTKSGLIFVHEVIPPMIKDIEHIHQFVLGSGSSVSVSDVNGDGYSDVYVTMMTLKPNKLFLNNKDGTFTDGTDQFFKGPVNDRYISLKPTFFDCDNDGDQDLFINTSSCPKFYINDGKRFWDVSDKSGLSVCHSYVGNVIDINNDGLLDLVYGSYNIHGSDIQFDNFNNADRSREFHGAFLNKGQCQFSELKNSGIEDVGLTHSIGVADIRGIGRKDIWFVTDVGTDRIFLDNGNGTFTSATDRMKNAFQRHGMSFDVSYEEGSTKPLVYVSHIFSPYFMVEGNALWKMNEAGEFDNLARQRGVSECGHAWGGRFWDLEFDGDEDLIVTNGFVSRNRKKEYVFPVAILGMTHRGYMKYAKNWPKMGDASYYGYQKNCIFLKDGENFAIPDTLNDLSSDELDGRAIATIDPLNDGNPWILIANQFQPLKAFRIEQKSGNNWLGFKLQGTCSNRDAYGTKVLVKAGGRNQLRWYYPSNGLFSQSENSLIVGMEKKLQAEEVVVTWPSGFIEKFSDLEVNKYHALKEGADCARKN